MTMHLMQGLTTTSTKKRKRNITKAEMAKYEEDCRLYNKRMKQAGRHDDRLTLDEYIDFCHGIIKPRPKVEREFKEWKPNYAVRRETQHIPSLDSGTGYAPKAEPKQYTGDLIVGIATMHKSNAVPVMRGTKQAEEISKMRR
jgi:hypothetical protein